MISVLPARSDRATADHPCKILIVAVIEELAVAGDCVNHPISSSKHLPELMPSGADFATGHRPFLTLVMTIGEQITVLPDRIKQIVRAGKNMLELMPTSAPNVLSWSSRSCVTWVD